MRNQTTLQAIADCAGVSKMTVSLALRNSPKLKPETVSRLQKLAEEMSYSPNPLVSAHMSQLRITRRKNSTVRIAFLSPMKKTDGKVQKYYMGAYNRASHLGYKLEFFQITDDISPERMSDILFNRGISGVIIGAYEKATWDFHMAYHHFAIATMGYSIKGLTAHRACSNHYAGIRMACHKLTQLNYKRIGLLLDADSSQRTEYHWVGGYMAFAKEHLHTTLRLCCVLPEFTADGFKAWYKSAKPDVIITSRKLIKIIHSILNELNIQCPQDVGLVNLHFTKDIRHFTSVDQHTHITGASAANLVIEQLLANEYGLPEIPKVIYNDNSWIEGNTTRIQRL